MQLSKAIDICKAAEASEQQLHTLAEEKNDRKRDSRHKDWKQDNQETRGNKHKRQTPDNKSFRRNCGRSPPPPPTRQCRAYGKSCNACHKLNHFAKCCRSKPPEVKKVDNVSTKDISSESDSSDIEFIIGTVNTHVNNEEWVEKIQLNNHSIKCKNDAVAHN